MDRKQSAVDWRVGGRPLYHVKYIRETELSAWEAATENYRRFMALVDRYVDVMSKRVEIEIAKECANAGRTAQR